MLPRHEMVAGIYSLTMDTIEQKIEKGNLKEKIFSNSNDALLAYEYKKLNFKKESKSVF